MYGAISIAALISIFYLGNFPTCFVEGTGLTTFKIASEVIIATIILFSIILAVYYRKYYDKKILSLLIISYATTILSEIALCFFQHPQDIFITIGHVLKIISFSLIYHAIVKTMIKTPYKELTHSQERYRQLINTLPLGIFINIENKIAFVNPALCKMLRVSEEKDLVGKNIFDIIVPDNHLDVKERINRMKQGETVERLEEKYFALDGGIIDVEVTATPLYLHEKEAILVILKDITARKQTELLERRIHINKLELQRTKKHNKLKAEFFNNLSHEMRTPLNVIFGIVQLLELQVIDKLEKVDPKEMKRHIKTLKQNTYRMLKLINNLLDINKIDAGHFQLNLENHNIIPMIEDITTSVVTYAKNKNINIVFDTEIEEKIIAVDPDGIERIMLNLLSNAIKFTAANGSIEVSIGDKGGSILIVIKDTGIGISSEKLPFIFNRFIQDNSSLKKQQQGTGIGLSLVQSIVKLHGGEIEVESQVGKGTTFYVELPVRTHEDAIEIAATTLSESENRYVEKINIEFSDIYAVE